MFTFVQALLIGLWIYNSDQLISNFDTQVVAQAEVTELVKQSRFTQLHFKKQVQEWKNILLRGHNASDYEKYYQQFTDEENLTHRAATKLLPFLGEMPAAKDQLQQFINSHLKLSQQYQLALQKHDNTEVNWQISVDKMVRGIDREPTDMLDQLVVYLVDYDDAHTALLVKNQQSKFAANLFVGIGIIFMSCLVYLWVISRVITTPLLEVSKIAREISAGNFNNNTAQSSNDEIGEMFDALKKIETNLSKIILDLKHQTSSAIVANTAKSEFISSMSHELRTPMNAVLGFSQLLESDPDSPLTEDQLESVSYIRDSGYHLLQLIDGVLDLSKVESGHSEVSIESVNLNKLFSEIVNLTKHDADKASITLINKTTDELVLSVEADYSMLKQVLLNFTSNAIKYNSEQGVVTLSYSASEDGMARLIVSDTGMGVPEDSLSALFEPFNRLGRENSAILGTGIGLTISKKLTELMGGKIGMFNNPDQGSTFWVELKIENSNTLLAGVVSR